MKLLKITLLLLMCAQAKASEDPADVKRCERMQTDVAEKYLQMMSDLGRTDLSLEKKRAAVNRLLCRDCFQSPMVPVGEGEDFWLVKACVCTSRKKFKDALAQNNSTWTIEKISIEPREGYISASYFICPSAGEKQRAVDHLYICLGKINQVNVWRPDKK